MVAESGARLLDADAQAALVELVVAARDGRDAEPPEARVLAGDGALDGEALARAVHALGPGRSSSPAAPREARRRAVRRRARGRDRRRALPGRRRARLGLHALARRSPPASRSATTCRRRRARPSGSRRRPSATACAEIGRGAGPVNALGLGAKVGGAAGGL
jgi:hypothetical protein